MEYAEYKVAASENIKHLLQVLERRTLYCNICRDEPLLQNIDEEVIEEAHVELFGHFGLELHRLCD